MIPLCVVPHYKEPAPVKPYVAAVLNCEFQKYIKTQWDLTTLRVMWKYHVCRLHIVDRSVSIVCFKFHQILPYINGFNHIDRIAAIADVALGLVLDCIKHLVLLGVAIMVPVFQYSNVYRPTPKLAQLAKCKALQQRCIEQCSKVNYSNCNTAVTTATAKVRDVFRIFASMAHGATFGELCVRFNPAALNINEKQMVLFGLLEGLIRRVDKYPITVQRNLFYDDEPIRPSCNSAEITVNNMQRSAAVASTTVSKPNNSKAAIAVTSTNSAVASVTSKDSKFTIFNNCGSQPLPRGERSGKSHAHHHSRAQNSADMETDTTSHPQRQRQPSITQSRVRGQSGSNHTYHYYNGLHSFDEICTKRGISSHQLEAQLSKDRHVIVLLRWFAQINSRLHHESPSWINEVLTLLHVGLIN